MPNSDDQAGQRPFRTFQMTAARRIGDRILSPLIKLGLVPGTYLLTTRGRKTGRPRTNPVTLIERDGKRWLVAPYGPVPWVLNARAAGEVTLRRGRRTEHCALREVPAQEAGPVLQRYLAVARPTRPYFDATVDSPVEAFTAEAGRHPVFELTRIS